MKGIFHFLTSWGSRHVLTREELEEISNTTIVCYRGEKLYSLINFVPDSVIETITRIIGQELKEILTVFGTYYENDGALESFQIVFVYQTQMNDYIVAFNEA